MLPPNVNMASRAIGPAPAFVRAKLASSGGVVKLLTLVLVQQGTRLLLGEKKRGFGKGYINGFGGKVEEGETVAVAAARELYEEAGITADALNHTGTLTFVFDDQEEPWEVHVFKVERFTGEPRETEEMAPLWVEQDQVPYHRMWADDVFWYPLFLRGQLFQGLFAFMHTNQLVWHTLAAVDALQQRQQWSAELQGDTAG